MDTPLSPAIRELDHRHADGIDVRLLWNPQTNRVSVAVRDERSGESLAFSVDGADALAAFHHPYCHANNPCHLRIPGQVSPQGEHREPHRT
jgi:YD repeat-containing protein